MSEPLVVIGNGMAAARFVEELAKRALGRYAVAVIGDEPRLAYNRVLLSALLAQEVGFSDIELKPARWWRDRGVTLRYGMRATAVDPVARNVTLCNGRKLPFSKLVFATGSQPIKLRIPGMDLPGVFTFRDIDDVNTIAKAARGPVVVIGGGLLGLEAAYGLAKARAQVTVLHLMDRLMERQLDAAAARMLRQAVEAKGIAVRLEAESVRIIGKGRVEAVELREGSIIPADAVVVAVGIRANTELARTAGLEIDRGIVVDDHLETSVAGIRRVRRASRALLRPGRAGLRAGAGIGTAACRRDRELSRKRARHQFESGRSQRVFGRRFPCRHGRRRGDHAERSGLRRLQEARHRE
jgi:nitrite reductase [NAD(P)H] large subunit